MSEQPGAGCFFECIHKLPPGKRRSESNHQIFLLCIQSYCFEPIRRPIMSCITAAPKEPPVESRYQSVYEASCREPEGFWLEAAGAVDWDVAPRQALDG